MKTLFSVVAALLVVLVMVSPAQAEAPSFSIEFTLITGGGGETQSPYTNPIGLSGTASATNFPGNLDQYQVQIEWGDGTVFPTSTVDFEQSGSDFAGVWSSSSSHSYPSDGPYTITAKLYHASPPGAERGDAEATITLGVNDPPQAADDAYSVDEDNTLDVPAPGVLGNDSDPEGDTLEAALDSDVAHGTLSLSADGSFVYTPDTDFNGSDSFTYLASDGNGGSDTATVTITVNAVNDAPQAADDAYSIDEDNTLDVPAPGVLGNDSDPEGDALQAALDTNVSHGTLSLSGDGSFVYTPDPGFNGSDGFTYSASDGNGGSDTATVTITVNGAANTPPVAGDDTATTDENTPVTVDVLANDSDPDAGDILTVTDVSDPAHGSAVINADYTVTYTPDPDFYGSDSFTYTVTDGTYTDTATVSVTVNATPAPPAGPVYIPPFIVSIEVAPSGDTVGVGQTLQFAATAAYSDGTSTDVTSAATWASSDSTVAAIDDTGLATGLAVGATDVTASFGGITSGPATLEVTAAWPGAATCVLVSIEVTPGSASIPVGQNQQFTATGTCSGGNTTDITSYVVWASSDASVLTIDDDGLATGVAVGTVGITATLAGITSQPVTSYVVLAPAVLLSIEVSPESASVIVGHTAQFKATGTYSDGNITDITCLASWATSDALVLTIEAGGVATGLAAGSAEITASLDGVNSQPATSNVLPAPAVLLSIEVTPESASIPVGHTQQFTATGTYSDGTIVDINSRVSWASSDSAVATIEAGGLATGLAAGTAEVTATLDGVASGPASLRVALAVPWALIGGIVGGVLAAALILFLLVPAGRGGPLWQRLRDRLSKRAV